MSDRHLAAVDRSNTALRGLEDAAIARLESALEASYRQLEKQLLASYPNYSAEAKPDLLANQRALLLADELKTYLPLINPQSGEKIRKDFEILLQAASQEGVTLSDELMRLTGGDDFVTSTARVPIEAAAIAAEGAYKRLEKHGNTFAEKSTAIITQGLIQGWGTKKVTAGLRQQLGVTKQRGEAIARTEVLTANNQAAQQNYKANGVEFFQAIATADSRTCGFCVARNLKVYEIGKASLPWHVMCRCYSMPWKKEWADLGLIDGEWADSFQEQVLDELKATGREPNPGLAPFEKANGIEAAKSVWEPGDRPSSLQSLMKTGRARIAELGESPDLKQFEQLRAKLLKGLSPEQAESLTHESSLTDAAEVAAVLYGGEEHYVRVLSEFHQMTAGNVKELEGFIHNAPRAHADIENRVINVGDEPSASYLFHELGHFLEADNPELARAARQWRDAKATGEARSLNELVGDGDRYEAEETAVPDHFATPYVGKVYDSGLTEVVSVGLEHFASAEGMQQLAMADLEHFAFIVGAIEAAQQQRLGARRTGNAPTEPLFMDWYGQRPLTPVEEEMRRGQSGGYRPLTPVEEAMRKLESKRASEFEDYLKREEESIRRRTSGEIDRQLREYYDEEAAALRRRLGIPDPKAAKVASKAETPEELALKPVTPTLKPIKLVDELDGVTPANETQQRALAIAREYQILVAEANEALGKIPSEDHTLPPDAYERIYGAINGLMDRLKGAVNEAKALTGKTQDPILEKYLGAIASASKEALPGYQIRSVNSEIEKKAEVRPC